MGSRQVVRRRRGQENETPEQGGMQVTNAFWNRILDMRSESIVMTREDMDAFYRDAVNWFESMRPRDRMGNTVVSQMPRLLRIAINAFNMCQTALTPYQREAGEQMLRDALDMMSDLVGSLRNILEEEARVIHRAIQNRRQFNAKEQGILDKMKQFLWTERSTTEIVAVALLTCAALYGVAWGLGMIGGAAATGTAEAAVTTAVAEAAGTAATGTAGAAAAAGTAATGTAGAAASAEIAVAAGTAGTACNATAITAVVDTGGTKAALAVAMVTMS